MNQQERDMINGLFDRLRQVEAQPRDAEAETLIKDRLARQPAAAYAMTQAVIVQEHALTGLQQQVEDLQRELEQLRQQPPQQSGGFLSGLFGGGAPQPSRPMMPPQPAPGGPWGSPQQQPQAPGPWAAAQQQAAPRAGAGGGFLATAAMTAVGIGGGILAANAISNMFGGGGGDKANSLFGGDKTGASAPESNTADNSQFASLGPNDSAGGYSSDVGSGYDGGYDSGGFDGGSDA